MFTKIKSYYQHLIPQLQEEDWDSLQQRLSVQYLRKGELLTRNGETVIIAQLPYMFFLLQWADHKAQFLLAPGERCLLYLR